jgi:hypothetical protein
MKEHEINKLENFVCGWYIEDTALCDDIVACFNNEGIDKNPGFVYTTGVGVNIDKTKKDSVEASLDHYPYLLVRYIEHLQKCIEVYTDKYEYAKNYGVFRNTEEIKIQYYPPNGGFFVWHAERTSNLNPYGKRHLVFMTYLNDVTDGGETEFYYQKIKIKPEKGLTLMWPADWTYTHRGIASPSQEKYIVTGWLDYDDKPNA